ncbi:MAG: M15 family metallopeptidase [Candidatus Portnoybacteria bacterium]|nr:M15 family metallopeptidase [Candidatus Portnoybacteria bacterium]
MARAPAARQLAEAKKNLPEDWNFKIWDCLRPYLVQKRMMDSFARRIDFIYPKTSKKEKALLLQKFAGVLKRQTNDLGTHANGGSFDLTLMDEKGDELYMGTDHDDLTDKAATDYYESKAELNELEKEAKKNRKIMKDVLEKAGFVNYVPEWWHWSYDK